MKLILAIIKPHQLESVKVALSKVKVFRLTIMECHGFGRQHGKQGLVGGDDIALNLRRKIQVQVAVNDEFVQPTVNAIQESARTGEIGDGKIFVVELEDCIRIRTGERGPAAI